MTKFKPEADFELKNLKKIVWSLAKSTQILLTIIILPPCVSLFDFALIRLT